MIWISIGYIIFVIIFIIGLVYYLKFRLLANAYKIKKYVRIKNLSVALIFLGIILIVSLTISIMVI